MLCTMLWMPMRTLSVQDAEALWKVGGSDWRRDNRSSSLPFPPRSDQDLQKTLYTGRALVRATSMQKHADRCCSCHSIGMSLSKCLASLTNAVKFGGLQDRQILHVHYVHVAREMQMRRILFVGRHRRARTQDEKCFSFAESRAAAVST